MRSDKFTNSYCNNERVNVRLWCTFLIESNNESKRAAVWQIIVSKDNLMRSERVNLKPTQILLSKLILSTDTVNLPQLKTNLDHQEAARDTSRLITRSYWSF